MQRVSVKLALITHSILLQCDTSMQNIIISIAVDYSFKELKADLPIPKQLS